MSSEEKVVNFNGNTHTQIFSTTENRKYFQSKRKTTIETPPFKVFIKTKMNRISAKRKCKVIHTETILQRRKWLYIHIRTKNRITVRYRWIRD